jgi:hypothetical protein
MTVDPATREKAIIDTLFSVEEALEKYSPTYKQRPGATPLVSPGAKP